MSIAVIAGLGNPGFRYRNTRHNIGFHVVDSLAESLGAKWKSEKSFQAKTAFINYNNYKLMLIKPQTFMNESGHSIKAVLDHRKLPTTSLLVIYDDINLELGRVKLSTRGSAGGHNGVSDILSKIGSEFLRYRIGIGPNSNPNINLADYVLGKFQSAEKKMLAHQSQTHLEHIQLIVDKGSTLAMNSINTRTLSTNESNN